MKIERRAADHLEHVGGRGLLLQRFAQSIEQPRILNRDDGLGGEAGDQLDLGAIEPTYLFAVDSDGADHLVAVEHRHRENSPSLCELSGGDQRRIAIKVGLFERDVGKLDRPLRFHHSGQRAVGMVGPNQRFAAPMFRKSPRHAVHCNGAIIIPLTKP